jgi:trimeric autotransporter adhesin
MSTNISQRVLYAALAALMFISAAVHTQTGTMYTGEIPMEDILDPRGRVDIRPGLGGTINHDGWQMTLGPNGEPRFRRSTDGTMNRMPATIQSQHEDEHWSDAFGITGVDESVYAISVIGDEIIIAGDFLYVNGMRANGIARWDGSAWHPLGDGVSGWIWTIEPDDEDIYIGGSFSVNGESDMSNIARWNLTTQTWHALGEGTNGTVRGIKVAGGNVYAGGQFTTAGGESANRVARWNGSQWFALGNGLNNTVWSMEIVGSELYVGGQFTRDGADTQDLRRLARWNGAAWFEVGGGVSSTVRALAVRQLVLFVGGNFTSVDVAGGGISINRIATWDGDDWMPFSGGVNGAVYDIEVTDDYIYVAGQFTSAGILDITGFARWDGEAWSSVDDGVDRWVYAVESRGDAVYIGGWFQKAGNVNITSLAVLRNGVWGTLGTAENNQGAIYQVYSLIASGEDLYVGGWFTMIGGIPANNIARWDGTQWHTLGDGLLWNDTWYNAYVWKMAISGNDLYVGGEFNRAGNIDAANIVRFNMSTQTWHALGEGTNGWIGHIRIVATNVFVGGGFTEAGGITVNNIARWNGSSWFTLGSGLNGVVRSIVVIGSDLYVGGGFTRDGDDTQDLRRVAQWNGSAWSEVGGGVNNTVYDMVSQNSDLFIGGIFTEVNVEGGGEPMSRITRWSGGEWHELSGGTDFNVYVLLLDEDTLYIGGGFTMAGALEVNRIARWDGEEWSGFGSGVNNEVYGLTKYGEDLYLGGIFSGAGGKPSMGIARWGSAPDDPPTDVADREHTMPESFRLEQNYPNPFNPSTVIRYSIPERSSVRLMIHNTLGQRVANPVNGAVVEPGFHEYQWSPSLPSGVYFYRLEATPLDNSRAPFVQVRTMLLMK